MNVIFLLDKCKEISKSRSESELAQKLGISKQAMSSYRNGTRLPEVTVCAALAELTGLPLIQVIGIVNEARATNKNEKEI
ncbi:MAG TPA: helix-turn-helix domain-containing protein [Xylella sp.]